MITGLEEAETHQLAKTHRCAEPGCNARLSVAWGGFWGIDHSILRCGRDAAHKAIKPYFASEREIRMVNASSSSLVKYETAMGPVEISVEAIRQYLCPIATIEEAYVFLQKCRFQRLNPFLGEAYLVVYKETNTSPRRAQMIIGKEAHTRRAERHPDYLGMEAGLIISREGSIEQVSGAFLAPGDQLLGGWCRVVRKGKEKSYISVTLKEYDTGYRQWKQMPATMIRKVAVVQALREAFPNEMAGLQGSEEFALAEEERQVIEGQLARGQTTRVTLPAGESGPVEDLVHTVTLGVDDPFPGHLPQKARDLERDIDELFPGDTMAAQEEPAGIAEAFDPETAPPPPLPASINARTHFEAVLKERGWDLARLQADVLHVPLDHYLRSHKLDEAYQLFRKHLASGT